MRVVWGAWLTPSLQVAAWWARITEQLPAESQGPPGLHCLPGRQSVQQTLELLPTHWQVKADLG